MLLEILETMNYKLKNATKCPKGDHRLISVIICSNIQWRLKYTLTLAKNGLRFLLFFFSLYLKKCSKEEGGGLDYLEDRRRETFRAEEASGADDVTALATECLSEAGASRTWINLGKQCERGGWVEVGGVREGGRDGDDDCDDDNEKG